MGCIEEDEAYEGRELNDAPEYFLQKSEYDTDSSVDDLDIDEVNDIQLQTKNLQWPQLWQLQN